jgi:hypothetical protein
MRNALTINVLTKALIQSKSSGFEGGGVAKPKTRVIGHRPLEKISMDSNQVGFKF